ncbi:hypothetical protein V8E55_007338 [Tylopilus felleus]
MAPDELDPRAQTGSDLSYSPAPLIPSKHASLGLIIHFHFMPITSHHYLPTILLIRSPTVIVFSYCCTMLYPFWTAFMIFQRICSPISSLLFIAFRALSYCLLPNHVALFLHFSCFSCAFILRALLFSSLLHTF